MNTQKNKLINISLFFFTIYTSLLFIQLYLQINKYTLYKNKGEEYVAKKNELETKKLVKEAKKDGYVAYYFPNTTVKFADKNSLYPVGSLPFTNSFNGNEGYGLIKYQTDRLGFRNKDSVWEEKNLKNSIFLIGDSFIEGGINPDESTIQSFIKKSYKRNVINLSSGGNSPYEYIAILEKIILPILDNKDYNIDIVLAFYDNDNIKNNSKLNNLINESPQVLSISKNEGIIINEDYYKGLNETIKVYIEKIKTHNYLIKKQNFVLKLIKLNDLRIMLNYPIKSLFKSLENIFNKEAYLDSVTSRSIKVLSLICKNKCNPYVTFIPSKRRSNYFLYNYGKEIEKSANLYGIKFINLQEEINFKNKLFYSPLGRHFSTLGNKIISEKLIKTIED